MLFGQGGFEPPTPWSRTKCASLCATIRQHLRVYVKERHLSIEDRKERLQESIKEIKDSDPICVGDSIWGVEYFMMCIGAHHYIHILCFGGKFHLSVIPYKGVCLSLE